MTIHSPIVTLTLNKLPNKKTIMIYREAKPKDISQIQIVRNSVIENTLLDPNSVSDQDCLDFITERGKGWVCEIDDEIVGFAIADLINNNIWALFIKPKYERKGIGKNLQEIMLNWYFDQGKEYVWLGTSPNTRAERFYRRSGWIENGSNGLNEIRFEMRKDLYMDKSNN